MTAPEHTSTGPLTRAPASMRAPTWTITVPSMSAPSLR